jgi:CRP/FNR family transcriptional regulator, cyclic AMP receptor protein
VDDGNDKDRSLLEAHRGVRSNTSWVDPQPPYRTGEFFKRLPGKAMIEFETLANHFSCASATILINEELAPTSILFLIEGRARLSINSNKGRRLIVGIAVPGEILGLTSAISGRPYEITAEALHPCTVASIPRQNFLDFLLRYPAAFQNVARELCLDNKRIRERLRTVGLELSAPAKLARLLMDWCSPNEHMGLGGRVWISFTHDEIAEHIGVSRETVTRCFVDFRNQGLVQQRGSILIIPNPRSLAEYTGVA